MKLQYISQRRQLIKSFYTGIGKTAVIFPSAFLAAVGTGLVSLGMIFYMRDVFNASPSQIGLLAALWSLFFILGCIFIRPLFDCILPRYTLIIAAFCMCISTLSIHYFSSITWIYILWSLYGLSTSLFWPPLMGWLSRNVEGIDLSRVISKFNFSWSAGIIIGPFLSGWLSERAAELPLYFGSGLFLLTGFLIVGATLVLSGIRSDRDTEFSIMAQRSESGQDTLIRYPAWVGIYTTFAVAGVLLIIFPISARNDLSMSKSLIGLLLLSRALFVTLGFIILGKTTFWHFKTLPMLLGQACLVVLLFFMVYVRSPLLLGVVLGFIGLLMALSYSASLFHGVSGSTNRAGRMAVNEMLISAGLITGSSIGGILYQKYSMAAVYWFCAGLVFAGILIQTWLSLSQSLKSK